jgi:hypothetical protein
MASGLRMRLGLFEPGGVDEEDLTGRFSTSQLKKLVTRSTESSRSFDDGAHTAPVAVVPRREPTVSRPDFLTKSTAVLVLPAPKAAPAPAPSTFPVPASAPAPKPSQQPTVVITHRRVRRVSRSVLRRRLFTLALLGLVVACQPWWWNVGDLHSHPSTQGAHPPELSRP